MRGVCTWKVHILVLGTIAADPRCNIFCNNVWEHAVNFLDRQTNKLTADLLQYAMRSTKWLIWSFLRSSYKFGDFDKLDLSGRCFSRTRSTSFLNSGPRLLRIAAVSNVFNTGARRDLVLANGHTHTNKSSCTPSSENYLATDRAQTAQILQCWSRQVVASSKSWGGEGIRIARDWHCWFHCLRISAGIDRLRQQIGCTLVSCVWTLDEQKGGLEKKRDAVRNHSGAPRATSLRDNPASLARSRLSDNHLFISIDACSFNIHFALASIFLPVQCIDLFI